MINKKISLLLHEEIISVSQRCCLRWTKLKTSGDCLPIQTQLALFVRMVKEYSVKNKEVREI